MLIGITKGERTTVREALLNILADEFPLSTNQLRSKIRRSFGLSVTYQAVHKELIKLEKYEVVEKQADNYLLSLDWIKNNALFFSQTELNYCRIKRYSANIIRKVQEEGDLVNLEFSSISELDDYFVNIMDNFQTLAPKNTSIIMHYRHNWYPILYAKKEVEIIQKNANNSRFYCLCGSNTAFDRWSTAYENSIGMHVKYKRGVAEKWDLQVYGDVIIQFHLDPQVTESMDAFFKNNVNILHYNPKELIDIMNRRGKFTVMIYKNALLAEQLRKTTEGEFL
jgi:hypothetical protein